MRTIISCARVLKSAKRQLMRPYLDQVLDLTARMSQLAMRGRWFELMERMDERAQVMQQLPLLASTDDIGMLLNLQHAVMESDRAMNTVMSLALTGSHGQDAA